MILILSFSLSRIYLSIFEYKTIIKKSLQIQAKIIVIPLKIVVSSSIVIIRTAILKFSKSSFTLTLSLSLYIFQFRAMGKFLTLHTFIERKKNSRKIKYAKMTPKYYTDGIYAYNQISLYERG